MSFASSGVSFLELKLINGRNINGIIAVSIIKLVKRLNRGLPAAARKNVVFVMTSIV